MEVILVDGSNVARARGSHPASYDDLLAIEDALQQRGYQPRIVVDASLRHRLRPDDADALDERILDGDIEQVTKGHSADAWLVAESQRLGALIVTNDKMREWLPGRAWLQARLISFHAGTIHFPNITA